MRKAAAVVIAVPLLLTVALTGCTATSSSPASSSPAASSPALSPSALSSSESVSASSASAPVSSAAQNSSTAVPISTAPAPPVSPATIGPEVLTPVVVSVSNEPIPVKATDGRTFLAYELSLINGANLPVTVDSVQTLDQDGVVLQRFSGAELLAHFRATGATPSATPATAVVLAGGQHGIIWMDPSTVTGKPIPTRLSHRVAVHYATAPNPLIPAKATEDVAATTVRAVPAPTIASPLFGSNWLDGNGCCDEVTPHRGAVSPINGQYFAPERFAIDWVQLTADRKLFTGDISKISSYAYYGASIHAVTNGTIVAVKDDMKDEVPGANPPVGSLTVNEYGGNYVVEMFQQAGETYYAFYAHLKPGSASEYSQVGAQVKTGDIVGELGNTGNTDSPHLHFHVMDTPNPLASNGLPFQLTSVALVGRAPDDQAVIDVTSGKSMPLVADGPGGSRPDTLPLYLDLVDFAPTG